jgi:hypothetical protein
MLSSLWSGGALPPLQLRSCQKLTSRAATDRARHLKRAIPCYRVSNCGKLQRASRSPNQYFSIHAAYVRNASFEVLILTVILPCRWWPFQCGTHGLSNLIYTIPKYIIRMRVASNLFAGIVVLFLPQRKRCLDCHDIRPGLKGATSSPIGGGEVAKRALLKRKIKEKSQALGTFLLKSLAGRTSTSCRCQLPDLTHASDTASLQKSLWSVSDHLSSNLLRSKPLQHGLGGQSLTGRDSRTPCDRVAFRKGTPIHTHLQV